METVYIVSSEAMGFRFFRACNKFQSYNAGLTVVCVWRKELHYGVCSQSIVAGVSVDERG